MTISLEEMAKLADAATSAPWELHHNNLYVAGPTLNGDWDWVVCAEGKPNDGYTGAQSVEEIYGHKVADNNRFIAASREFVPWACAEIRRLEALLRPHGHWCAHLMHDRDRYKAVLELMARHAGIADKTAWDFVAMAREALNPPRAEGK